MRYIYKLLNITAILLLILMPVAIFSGFFMAKNFMVPWIDIGFARYMHSNLPLLLLILVSYVHSLAGMLVVFSRKPKWNKKVYKIPVCAAWTLLFLLMIFFFVAQAYVAQAPVK